MFAEAELFVCGLALARHRVVSVSFETGNDDQSGVDVKLPVRANWPARPSRNHGELCS